jgi:2-polyprenyl-3-methyl-5-hydroxy-6-metoxy-1,4-benzoquinol methylase
MKTQEKVYRELDEANLNIDPWQTEHPYNKKAFDEILSLIKMAPHESILEVGCGQGAFTKKLAELTKDVTAIDVSESAIAQAKKNVNGARFQVSSLENFYPKRRYDVVVCAEILYYIKDHEKAIKRLQELGGYLVTSQYVFCLPRFSFGTLRYEWALRRLPLIKRTFATYPWPPTLTVRTLRKLS